VSERWILNASPLIVLARVGQAHLLTVLPEQVVVPDAVAAEIEAGPDEDPARAVLRTSLFNIVATPLAPNNLLTWDLGAGETAVLSLAVHGAGWTINKLHNRLVSLKGGPVDAKRILRDTHWAIRSVLTQQTRQLFGHLTRIADDGRVGLLQDRRVGIGMHGDDVMGVLHAEGMHGITANTQSNI
jgi:hypothetical protein